MANYTRPTVMSIAEQLHLCMAKAINTAMIAQVGANWFEEFKKFDKAQPQPVLDGNFHSVSSMDFQSCLKFFRYREDHAKIVFEHYGHNFFAQADDVIKAYKQLNNLLDNLIRNVRNYLYAHASASMVESGTDSTLRYSVYGADDAVHDMLKLSGFFSSVTNESGITYHKIMSELAQQTNAYSVSDTIKSEDLRIDASAFVTACLALNIPVSTDISGNLNFSSSNYNGDIARIKLHLTQSKSKTNKKALIIVIILVILLVAGAAIAIFFGLGKDSSRNSSDNPVNTTQAISTTEAVPTQPTTAKVIEETSSPLQTETLHFICETTEGRWKKDEINVIPKECYFENGKCVFKAYIINGYSTTATNVYISRIILTDANGVTFVDATFPNRSTQNFTIASHDYTVHTFNITGEALLTTDVDLSYIYHKAKFDKTLK